LHTEEQGDMEKSLYHFV